MLSPPFYLSFSLYKFKSTYSRKLSQIVVVFTFLPSSPPILHAISLYHPCLLISSLAPASIYIHPSPSSSHSYTSIVLLLLFISSLPSNSSFSLSFAKAFFLPLSFFLQNEIKQMRDWVRVHLQCLQDQRDFILRLHVLLFLFLFRLFFCFFASRISLCFMFFS